jgi:hypothetical protein
VALGREVDCTEGYLVELLWQWAVSSAG